MMSRRVFAPILVVAACAWLAAGPGGVTLGALAACWHGHGTHPSHDGGGRHGDLPPGTPCFCDEMTGGHEVLTAPAAPAPTPAVVLAADALDAVPFPLPPSPVPSCIAGPTPPPPNPLA